jgi:hypothetical protein
MFALTLVFTECTQHTHTHTHTHTHFRWLWEEVDVLCPSIYPRTNPFNASVESASVNSTVSEAVRAAGLVKQLHAAV